MSLKRIASAVAALVTVGTAVPARAENLIQTNNAWLDAGAMAQLLGLGENVRDPYRADNRVYLFMKEARLKMSGGIDGYSFDLMMALGGEDAVLAPNPGVTLSLLDADLNIPVRFLGNAFIKVGQFKVPYGREELTYSGNTQFVDRSIDYMGFQVGRDVGASFNYRRGKLGAIAGVFTGGGRDVPPAHYLPESLNVPLIVARAGYGDVDDNPYLLSQNDLKGDHLKWGVNVSGLYMKDSRVGHSTTMNIKLSNKSLLLDGNWNPLIGQAPSSLGQWFQMGADAALRMPLGNGHLSAEAQADWAGYSNQYGELHVAGVRAQAGYAYKVVEVAVRYAVLFPDRGFQANGVQLTGRAPIYELTPAISWYLRGHALKLVADAPVLFNMPVVTEPNVGSYVVSDMPDQVSGVGKGTSIAPQRVAQARLMIQGEF